MLGAENIEDAIEKGLGDQLTNILMFLQSLDRDHNPDNGIDLGDLDAALADMNLDFDQESQLFIESEYKQLVNENGGVYITADQAQRHFAGSLGVGFSLELPAVDSIDNGIDGSVDHVATYVYNEDGRLIEISEAPGVGLDPIEKNFLDYDSEGRLIELVYDDLENDDLHLTRTYAYENNGRLSTIEERDAENTLLAERSWTYDSVGNVLTEQTLVTEAGYMVYDILQTSYDVLFNLEPYKPGVELERTLGSIFQDENFEFEITSSTSLQRYEYEENGRLASANELFEYEIVQSNTAIELVASSNTIYEKGLPLTISSTVDVRYLEIDDGFSSETDIAVNYSEGGDVLSCDIEVTGSLFRMLSVSYLQGEMEVYSCGDVGIDETIVTKDENGHVTDVIYIDRSSTFSTEKYKQNISYDNGRVVQVVVKQDSILGVGQVGIVDQISIDNLLGDDIDSEFVEVVSTKILSREYDYTESGKLSYVEEIYDDHSTALQREYQSVEIR
ncbi:hypothetical protein [Oceanicoccus sagamiensis]|uniref:Uncharacterized protein n=1 Tax=Oceanicoccus sagamiensis TaxID=716816 RepID=A0A1X9NAT1_9GAMM|nr:hypothetical protein [Oceanicoccus sagamiensis]ARN72649.1 hypothetical protein BST96_00080 [Oceanicoccus sagamiensis]